MPSYISLHVFWNMKYNRGQLNEWGCKTSAFIVHLGLKWLSSWWWRLTGDVANPNSTLYAPHILQICPATFALRHINLYKNEIRYISSLAVCWLSWNYWLTSNYERQIIKSKDFLDIQFVPKLSFFLYTLSNKSLIHLKG